MTDRHERCPNDCTIGYIRRDDGAWAACQTCGGTGLREVAEVRSEFHAGYIAGIWVDEDTA